MSNTYAIVQFHLEDTTAQEKAEYTFTEAQDFSADGTFRTTDTPKNYGYTGFNQFALDGSRTEAPDDRMMIGFCSKAKSKQDQTFDKNPEIYIKFHENHTSTGITLYFAGEPAKKLHITWYDRAGDKLTEGTYTPVSLVCFCRKQVRNYGAIRIEFLQTHYPQRCIRLHHIVYGQYINWTDLDVKTAKVTEQIDESNATQPVNTAQVEVIDEDNDFDIANPNGAWNSVEYYQKLILQEYKDGEIIDCGTFYLNGWDFKSNLASFKMVDAIGYLDTAQFKGGIVYDHTMAKDVIDSIMAAAGWTDYEIQDDLQSVEIVGYLKAQSCRNALREVCFALGAQAFCSRSDKITIKQADRYISTYVGPDRKFMGKTSASLGDYVSSIEVTLPNYSLDAEAKSVYKATNPAGTYDVSFSSPVDPTTIKATGCEVSNAHESYCAITVKTAGECEITARAYTNTPYTLTRQVDSLDAGQTAVTKKYTAQIYAPGTLYRVMRSLLSYYQLRKTLQMTYLLDTEMAGKWVEVGDTQNQRSSGLIKEQTIDLTGGFIATAKVVGYEKISTASYFAGKELYTGDNIII